MEKVVSHANVIVPEVLKGDNYKRWSIFMRYYLVGQDLWDVVELSPMHARGNVRSEWVKKNALALHAIMISCEEEVFDQIKEIKSAKDVWDALAEKFEPDDERRDIAVSFEERRRGPRNPAGSEYETLFKAISNGMLWQVKKFFRENPRARSARICENGYTALHLAVYNRKGEIVDYLTSFNRLSKEDMEIKDDSGSTALSIAARCGVGKSIAKSLVRMNHDLLTIQDEDGKIPVELACNTIQEDMTRYLYHKTPLQFLKGDRGFYVLQECIARKMFDIAYDLLHHSLIADLAADNYSLDSVQLILTLVQTPSPFFKGSNLSFRKRWIYNSIRAKACVIKEDKHRSCVKKIQDFYQSRSERIHEIIQRPIQNIFHELFEGIPGDLLNVKIYIIGIPLAVLCMSVFLIGRLAQIMLSFPMNFGKLILGALRILVSMLSRVLETDLYKIKLMDECARKVIHLICSHESFSKLDEIQFVHRAVEATFQAIKNGIPEIVKEITKANPSILWSFTDPEDSRSRTRNIFACAVEHHQEEAAHFLYEFAKEEKEILFTTDEVGNNTLHLAAKLAPHYQLGCISGAALQLQSELRWFKEVKTIVPQSFNEKTNEDNETPWEVFVREHNDLLKEAEEWVKKTAESSTVVGALIITIMFAATFTVPGGNDQSTGFPIFLHKSPIPFMVFMVSDAISLFAASSSVLMFLGILTSRYAHEDFRKSLPIRLIIGLSSLFISIATMTTAFCAALFILLHGRVGVVIPITLLSGIPVTFFVLLQFPLLVEIYVSTFRRNNFEKEEKSWIIRMTDMFMNWGLRTLRPSRQR